MQFYPASLYFLSYRSKYPLQHPICLWIFCAIKSSSLVVHTNLEGICLRKGRNCAGLTV